MINEGTGLGREMVEFHRNLRLKAKKEVRKRSFIGRLLSYLGFVSYCPDCKTKMVFDQERFDLGYSARSYCPECRRTV